MTLKEVILAAMLALSPGHPKADGYAVSIAEEAPRHDLPPGLVVAVMYNESRFRVRAMGGNKDGSFNIGLMQLNDKYLAAWGDLAGAPLSRAALYDPATNTRLGVAYLARVRDRCLRFHPSSHHVRWWGHYACGAYKWGPACREYADNVAGHLEAILTSPPSRSNTK